MTYNFNDLKGRNCVITGGFGVIGLALCKGLAAAGVNLAVISRRAAESPLAEEISKEFKVKCIGINAGVTDKAALSGVVLGFEPDYIVHLAARTDLDGKSVDDYQANTTGVENVLQVSSQLKGLKKILITSSMLVCHTGYMPKDQYDYAPTTFYGESKVVTEQLTWKNKPTCDWAILRPTSMWGPWFDVPYRNFFDIVGAGRYVHIGHRSCTKTYGYIENAVYQIDSILMNPTMWWGLLRQVGLAAAVSLIVGTCGMLIGYACVRRRGAWISHAVENLAFFPYLMPAMAFGTIYLAVATSASFKWMYGSFFLLGLVAAVKFLPFASRSGVNSMMQIAPEIEEAAVIFGVPWVTRMSRILFPIQKSAIISGYLLPVINVMREVALFTLLVPYPRYLLTTMLFSFNETGYAQYGSAVTLLIILIIITINTLVNKLTGASFDKGIGG